MDINELYQLERIKQLTKRNEELQECLTAALQLVADYRKIATDSQNTLEQLCRMTPTQLKSMETKPSDQKPSP